MRGLGGGGLRVRFCSWCYNLVAENKKLSEGGAKAGWGVGAQTIAGGRFTPGVE